MEVFKRVGKVVGYTILSGELDRRGTPVVCFIMQEPQETAPDREFPAVRSSYYVG